MRNTGDQGSRGATLVAPNKYSGEAVGLMCVCYGNTQPACHKLNSSCCLQGHRESCSSRDHNKIDLVRVVDHVFVEILGMIPQFLCGMLRLTPQTYHQT